jgi:hypothetical protein
MAEPNLSDFWPNFNDSSKYIEVVCDFTGSLAQDVIEHFLPGMCNDSTGGTLEDVDIKQMDAFTVVKLSLLQASADDNKYYEAVYNHSNGKVEFKAIGTYNANITDVYYTVATFNYIEECNGVMITGKKPLAERKALTWKPIWGNLTVSERIFDTSDMTTGCNADNFSQYATIVYNDPHLTNNTQGYEDGLENLFEQGSTPGMDLGPYDSVIGYVKWKYLPEKLVTEDTEVRYNSNAYIPVKIGTEKASIYGPYVGKQLVKHPTFKPNFDDPACWEALSNTGKDSLQNWDDGLAVTIPEQFRFTSPGGVKVDKFLGITKVYVIGHEMEYKVLSVSPAASIKTTLDKTDIQLIVTVNKPNKVIVELERGAHWQVAYKKVNEWKEPRIIFADNSDTNNPYEFGNNCTFKVSRYSNYYDDNTGQDIVEATKTVLPITTTKGIIVEEIWAVVELETPSIIIYDPHGGSGGPFGDEPYRARAIAEQYDLQLAPMVLTEYPAPIGYNGRLLDQTVGLKDNDPTTAQNFEETELAKAMDEMNGGSGMTLNLSFLDEEQVTKLSGVLYTYMNGRDGQEKVYTCGPHCQPELGGLGPDGGIINQISYSYTDSQSYTISVNEGPRLVGQLAQIGTGPYFKQPEDVARLGIIIEDNGNHVHYKVRLDQYGERVAINCCSEILRKGDRVNCTIHNNAVEA